MLVEKIPDEKDLPKPWFVAFALTSWMVKVTEFLPYEQFWANQDIGMHRQIPNKTSLNHRYLCGPGSLPRRR